MNFPYLFALLGFLLILDSGFLILFSIIGFFIYPDEQQGVYFLVSSGVPMLLGILFRLNGNYSLVTNLTFREGFAIASLGWILVTFIGALPFYLSREIPSFTDSFFESMSGFTTTGATILTEIENKGHLILLWRSFIQWLGGMGVIVLTLAILPAVKTGGMQLFTAEVLGPGPTPDKIVPRVAQTAKNLYITYIAFTLIQILLLLWGGMNTFESLCHTFSTISSGGYSPLNNSIEAYSTNQYSENYLYYEIVTIIFMFLSGVNFSLHYKALTGNFKVYFKNLEFRYYLFITGFIILLISWDLWWHNAYSTFAEIFRYSVFTTSSILTGTGFTNTDFGEWSSTSKSILITIMFFGGMSGSTTGGVKIVRIATMLKEATAGIKHTIHPKRVFTIRFGDFHLSREVRTSFNTFMVLYIIIYVVGVIILSYTNLDIETLASMSVTTLANVGPGLGEVGPAKNYALLPAYAKWVLSLFMLLGRLELLPVLVLFLPRNWKK